MNEKLLSYLKESGKLLLSYYKENPPFALTPAELMEGTFIYFERGGKRLRPAICRLCAGALGGDEAEQAAIPCALGLELYHNWTLIHDDMIDHDDTRRGESAVHKLVSDTFSSYGPEKSREYGFDTALLAGDALHSASVYYISKLSDSGFVPPSVTLKILNLLEGEYGPRLISGETIDTKNGLLHGAGAFYHMTPEEVTFMMAGKTGALFAISALSGAMIGLGKADPDNEYAVALANFAENCGLAFQLQDDILGITSDEKTLGKPIGSDIREGKPTILLLTAYKNATEEEKAFLRRVVGLSKDEEEILGARKILLEKGVEETKQEANRYLALAEKDLAILPDSHRKELLESWRQFMLSRNM
ncbi:MAG: polyprenyl synthetase family protein [Clostridia bacterium]|nr:polyprenyl synthetase family protein [Clostridia bacterium]